MKKLLFSALIKFVLGALVVGLLVFLPAGSLGYTDGWVFMGILFIPMLLLGAVLLFKAPSLLEKRLDSKEKDASQRGVVGLSGLMFLAGFVVAGLDFRFGWSDIPSWLKVTAAVIFLLSYGGYAEVMRENEYLSRTVKVSEGQKVIDRGLYGIVRHPMYLVTVFMFLSIPIVLGSVWAFVIFLLYPVLTVIRLLNEEKLLERELEGYAEYKKRVKYRLIPFVW